CLGVVGELFRLFLSGRRRHTSSKRDWSSDVCSSDLYFHVTPTCPCSSASWRATRNTRRRPTPRSTCSGRCTTGCCTSPPRTRTPPTATASSSPRATGPPPITPYSQPRGSSTWPPCVAGRPSTPLLGTTPTAPSCPVWKSPVAPSATDCPWPWEPPSAYGPRTSVDPTAPNPGSSSSSVTENSTRAA